MQTKVTNIVRCCLQQSPLLLAVIVCMVLDARSSGTCSVAAFECRCFFRGPPLVGHHNLRRSCRTNYHLGLINSSPDDYIKNNIENESQPNGKIDPQLGTNVTVSHDGQSCTILVLPNESILSALERQSIYVQSQLTTLPDMPSDCRRGNCMTCAALIINSTHRHHPKPYGYSSTTDDEYDGYDDARLLIRTDDNGLSPSMSKHISDQGYLLTCSSFLQKPPNVAAESSGTDDSLQLELGVQDEIWNEVYAKRFTTPETQLVARTAMARVLRQSAERNLLEWMQSTERVLRQTETE